MRLIDADALLMELKNPYLCNITQKHLSLIEQAPTVDPVRHGHWIIMDNTYTRFKCSECDKVMYPIGTDWCPWCGAKMDEGNVRAF